MSNHEPAEACLIDLSRYRVSDLGAEATRESGLGHAVHRVLSPAADEDGAHHGFSNTI
jgi:FXSXX-COOH protein